MNILSVALSGIRTESNRLGNAANNIANINTPGFLRAQRAAVSASSSSAPTDQVTLSERGLSLRQSASVNQSEISDVNLAEEVVDLTAARNGVAFNTKVLKVQNEITKSLLDIVA